ncbi:MAG: phytoene/squalene synthase family protein [Candidatus Omnitrophica bacterium]|nr:phytoene/squalene synthase family protein [Candidatus Omnitrophota bacterium]
MLPADSFAIQKDFQLAEAITRQHAKSFYFASRFLSREKRQAAYTLYAVCRISDDAVDQSLDTVFRQNQLVLIQKNIAAAYAGPAPSGGLWAAFQFVIRQYAIPLWYFEELLDGQAMDLNKNRYANFPELYVYCYKVAGVVGLMMHKIFRCCHPAAVKHAIDLGVAMQLTNILRDIKEDAHRGRIYLPADEMMEYNISADDILKGRIPAEWKPFMCFQIQRAREYYSRALPGIKHIESRDARFVARAMAVLYADILTQIEKNQYNVFHQRAHTNHLRKILLLLTGQTAKM